MNKLGGCVRGKEAHADIASRTQVGPQGRGRAPRLAPAFVATLDLALLAFAIVGSIAAGKCANVPPAACSACEADPNLPGCAQLIAAGGCKPTTTTTSTTTTTTTQPQAVTPHPVCTVEITRITDCYHNPTGHQWLYACPLVDGTSVNVEVGKESTCPAKTPSTPPPSPSPAPATGCAFPQGLPENAFTFTPGRGQLQARVNFAVSRVGGGCSVGSACPLGKDPQAQIAKIVLALQMDGLCAGQDVTGVSDQFNVSLDCRTGWENYHSVKWPTADGDWAMAVWASRPTENCLGGRDAAGIPKDLGCPGVGGGSYRGELTIPPNSCAPPVVDACPVTPGMLDGHEPFRAAVKPFGPGVDLTLWGCGEAVVAKLDPGHVPGTTGAHNCLNFCCPFEQDKGTGPCADKLWGKAKYSVVPPESKTLTIETTANTNTVQIAGAGVVKLCGTVRPDDAAACWIFDYPCKPDVSDSSKCQKDKR